MFPNESDGAPCGFVPNFTTIIPKGNYIATPCEVGDGNKRAMHVSDLKGQAARVPLVHAEGHVLLAVILYFAGVRS